MQNFSHHTKTSASTIQGTKIVRYASTTHFIAQTLASNVKQGVSGNFMEERMKITRFDIHLDTEGEMKTVIFDGVEISIPKKTKFLGIERPLAKYNADNTSAVLYGFFKKPVWTEHWKSKDKFLIATGESSQDAQTSLMEV